MKTTLFWSGATLVAVGAGVPLALPYAPSAIQSNTFLQPIGSFIIDWGGWIALAGLVLMLIGLFI